MGKTNEEPCMTLARIFALAIALMIGSSAMAQETAKPEKKPGEKKPAAKGMHLAGVYTLTSGKKAGVETDKELLKGKCTITKKMITLESNDMKFEIAYTADLDAKPATIDMEITKPEEFASKAKGILKMEKNTLTLCYDPIKGERPKDFTSTPENGNNLFMLKKRAEREERQVTEQRRRAGDVSPLILVLRKESGD